MTYLYMRYIAPAVVLIPIIMAALVYKNRTGVTVLLIYLVLSALMYTAFVVSAAHSINNIPLVHIDTIIESVLLLGFFSKITKDQKMKKYLHFLMLIFPVFCCVNFIFFQSIHSFNTYARPAEAVLLILFSILYWHGHTDEDKGWTSIPENWFVSGILLYFSSSLLISLFSNYLAVLCSKKMNIFIWNLHATLLVIMYLFFTIGFNRCRK